LSVAYGNRGYTYLQLGQLDLALQDANTAIDLFPESAALYINRAIVHTNLADDESARLDAEKAIELGADPTAVRDLVVQPPGRGS